MIVQSALPNNPHLVITQIDHAKLSGDFATVFGNDSFTTLSPQAEMVHVATHHDDGWGPTDDACLMDKKTGLPYHLTQTPLTELIKTSAGSPEENESFHPYSGLLSSMHTYGLFNGRYGLSDKIFIDLIPTEHRPAMEAMLEAELDRQTRIKQTLAKEETFAPLISEDHLFANYKLLQFFDTLALYFHMVHLEGRGTSTFLNVPQKVGGDVTITIEPVGDGVYSLSPYPFNENGLEFSYHGRFLSPQPSDTDLKALMATQI